jgi:hypothetical protein
MELERDTADRLTSMQWYFRRGADGSFSITMEANATNPVAVSRYFGIVPAIHYSVDFNFAADRSVTVSGTHDGFPAYDFYLQRRQFHHYDPIVVGASPLFLFGFAPDIARRLAAHTQGQLRLMPAGPVMTTSAAPSRVVF